MYLVPQKLSEITIMNNRPQDLASKDVWLEIFSHVGVGVPHVAETCTFFNSLLNEDFWKKRIEKDFSDFDADLLKSLFEKTKSYKAVYKTLYIKRKFEPKTFIAFLSQGRSPDSNVMQNTLDEYTKDNGKQIDSFLISRQLFLSRTEAYKYRGTHIRMDFVILGLNLSPKDIADYKMGKKLIQLSNLQQHIVEISLHLNNSKEDEFHTFKVKDGVVIKKDALSDLRKRMK